jgi:hypothetical protein
VPGNAVVIEHRDTAADAITLRAAGHQPVVVGTAAARRIHAVTS